MLFKKPVLGYLAHSITNGSKNVKQETTDLANKIMAKHPNLILLTAINATSCFDELEGYKSIQADITLISRCDIFVLSDRLNYSKSCGCTWEFFIAKFLNKPVYTSDYLLGNSPNPLSWQIRTREQKLKQLLAKN